jgi:hypothetical protein
MIMQALPYSPPKRRKKKEKACGRPILRPVLNIQFPFLSIINHYYFVV